ncbi:glucosaminidase domain-containing protein [Candidatus Saccharibacteria bacterium]|nr:glucosaminidase domain-containing protein [Candidatus Saccharibacteria bacterium]
MKYIRSTTLVLAIMLYAVPGGVSAFNESTSKYNNYKIYFYDENSCISGGGEPSDSPTDSGPAAGGASIANVEISTYSPVKPGDPREGMEGGYGTKFPGPDGQTSVRTLDDVNSGTSKYVTLAGNTKYRDKTYTIPTITYKNINNESVTLTNVKAVVHDTGGAFSGKPEGRYDMPVGKDYPSSISNSQPFNGTNKIKLIPGSPGATSEPAEKPETPAPTACSCGPGRVDTSGGNMNMMGSGGPPPASREEFVLSNAEAAFKIGKANGIPYDAMIAQGALESGDGKSDLTTQGNNYFGIKTGSGWTGAVWSGSTKEEEGGKTVTKTDSFRAYPTKEAGWQGYADFIRSNKRYAAALQYPQDPFQYITELKKAGYATDSSYVSKNHDIIRSVQKIIAEKTDLPPSSEVVPEAQPAGGAGPLMMGGQGSGDPAAGATQPTCGTASSGSGNVSAEGYAYPIDATKSEQKNPALSRMPCPPSYCHGGSGPSRPATPAFDIGKTTDAETIGTLSFAIHDAVVGRISDVYEGNPNCYSINLEQINSKFPDGKPDPDNDGWQYWYGHQGSSLVTTGQKVAAGEPVSTIGPRSCARDGPTHLHIDRGSPKGRGGGAQCCRDDGLLPIMNKLWEALPE